MEGRLTPPPVTGRLAPTPSGYLHLGNILNFSLNWLTVRHLGGRLRLRIDDLDNARMRDAYLEDIFRVLDWLGMDWDEGPDGPDAHRSRYSQQFRLDIYRDALHALKEKGHLFACDCSRKQIRSLAPDGRYPGTCIKRELSFRRDRVAWRLQSESASLLEWEDMFQGNTRAYPHLTMPFIILRRKDGIPAYQLASVIDDELDGITHVIRGADLQASTAVQLYISQWLETRLSKATWGHHPLLMHTDGTKKSKSAGHDAKGSLCDSGLQAKAVVQWVGECLGIKESGETLKSLLARFSLESLKGFELAQPGW
ncbi:MAG: glutamate--tRNA ligase family protein [Bacteroidota bacterium]